MLRQFSQEILNWIGRLDVLSNNFTITSSLVLNKYSEKRQRKILSDFNLSENDFEVINYKESEYYPKFSKDENPPLLCSKRVSLKARH